MESLLYRPQSAEDPSVWSLVRIVQPVWAAKMMRKEPRNHSHKPLSLLSTIREAMKIVRTGHKQYPDMGGQLQLDFFYRLVMHKRRIK